MLYVGILIIICIIIILLIIYCTFNHVNINKQLKFTYKLPSVVKLNNATKIIWSYWDGADPPLSVSIAINTWYKHNSDYIVCILSNDNVDQYIDLSTLPKKYNEVSVQKKADIIRLALLEKYGGIWLDSTIYL